MEGECPDAVILLVRYGIPGAEYKLQAMLADIRLARLAWYHRVLQGSDIPVAHKSHFTVHHGCMLQLHILTKGV